MAKPKGKQKALLTHDKLVKFCAEKGPTRIEFLRFDAGVAMVKIGGHSYEYKPESQQTHDFWKDKLGRTFTVVAEGSKESAVLTLVGEPVAETPRPERTKHDVPASGMTVAETRLMAEKTAVAVVRFALEQALAALEKVYKGETVGAAIRSEQERQKQANVTHPKPEQPKPHSAKTPAPVKDEEAF